MTESRVPTVSDLGELELLARMRDRMREPKPRDDTAILSWPEDKVLLTTDMIVEGIDFDLSYAGGMDVGWKALAINASDIASMGGRPAHAVAAVGLRPETSVAFVDDFVDGLLAACDAYGAALVGGDVSAASEITAAIAMVGTSIGRPLERSGAAVGDAICITGSLGGAAAGLIALRRDMGDDAPEIARLERRHLRPTARVAEASALVPLGPTAMIDVSDGLAVDLGHLIEASDVGCEVDADAVPIDPDVWAIGDLDPLEMAVLGGEDFELLFTIDQSRTDDAAAALRKTGTPVVRIGTIVESGAQLGDRSLEEWGRRGWQHLRSR
jgi:thiamine-monophosphate kinase